MISSYITPAKRQLSNELEAMFQEHIVQGGQTKRFKQGESGGTIKFYAGKVENEGNKKPTVQSGPFMNCCVNSNSNNVCQNKRI